MNFPDEVLDAPPKQHPAFEWQLQPDSLPEPPLKKQCCDDLRDKKSEIIAAQPVAVKLLNGAAEGSHEDQVLLQAEDCAVAAPLTA